MLAHVRCFSFFHTKHKNIFQNGKRKHRTAVYVLIVTEECKDWHEGKCGEGTNKDFLSVIKTVKLDFS